MQAALLCHSKSTTRATDGAADQNQSRSYVMLSQGWKLLLLSQINLNNKNQSVRRELRKSAHPDTYKWTCPNCSQLSSGTEFSHAQHSHLMLNSQKSSGPIKHQVFSHSQHSAAPMLTLTDTFSELSKEHAPSVLSSQTPQGRDYKSSFL